MRIEHPDESAPSGTQIHCDDHIFPQEGMDIHCSPVPQILRGLLKEMMFLFLKSPTPFFPKILSLGLDLFDLEDVRLFILALLIQRFLRPYFPFLFSISLEARRRILFNQGLLGVGMLMCF